MLCGAYLGEVRLTWGLCGYVQVNKLTLAPFIGWKSGESEEKRKGGTEGEKERDSRKEREGRGERVGGRENKRERETKRARERAAETPSLA